VRVTAPVDCHVQQWNLWQCMLVVKEPSVVRIYISTPLSRTTSTVLDTLIYIASIMEELQGGLNGVEVVMFQRMDLLDSTIAHYVPRSG
jgi:hypothetical protein